MDSVIRYANKEIWLSFYDATVIHANKYAQTSGGWGDTAVNSTLYTDVVFRLKETGTDVSLTIVDVDVPIYNHQDVMVISANRNIIGYIDNQTKYYYYTTKDFSRLFKLGFPFYWIWVGTVLGLAISYMLDRSNFPIWTVIAFGISYGIFQLQKVIQNYGLKKEFDQFLR